MKPTSRPRGCETEHLTYLDDLRESGETNMYGARHYLMDAFPDLDEEEALGVLAYWMATFGEDDR